METVQDLVNSLFERALYTPSLIDHLPDEDSFGSVADNPVNAWMYGAVLLIHVGPNLCRLTPAEVLDVVHAQTKIEQSKVSINGVYKIAAQFVLSAVSFANRICDEKSSVRQYAEWFLAVGSRAATSMNAYEMLVAKLACTMLLADEEYEDDEELLEFKE